MTISRCTLAFATLVGLIASALAGGVEFVPLQNYVGQTPAIEKDPAALGYVADRCSALYMVFARGLEDETDPERQRIKREALSAGEKFMGAAARLMMRGTRIELKDALKRTSITVVGLSELYVDRIDAARLRAGNMFADPLIAGDFATCKGLLAKM